jgi:transposase InsO family protein
MAPLHTDAGLPFLRTPDDRTRIVYSEIHLNELTATAVAFWERANAFFNTLDITVERVLTDNGSCYRSRLWRDALEARGTTPKFTRPTCSTRPTRVARKHLEGLSAREGI